MSESTCSVLDCGRSIRTRGLCNPHYQRLKTTGNVRADRPIAAKASKVAPGVTCSVDGCQRRPKGRGWCLNHYKKWQRNGVPDDWKDPGCSIPDCPRKHYGGPGKWCRLHYRRWKTHGDPLKVQQPWQRMPRPRRPCVLDGCNKPHAALGMCRPHYTKDWIAKNRRRYDRWVKAYRKAHPEWGVNAVNRRRARLQSAPARDLTSRQWREIKAAYGNRCAYCNKRTKLTQDHVVPISKNGSHTVSNVVPACRRCNSRKGAGPAPNYQPLLF